MDFNMFDPSSAGTFPRLLFRNLDTDLAMISPVILLLDSSGKWTWLENVFPSTSLPY